MTAWRCRNRNATRVIGTQREGAVARGEVAPLIERTAVPPLGHPELKHTQHRSSSGGGWWGSQEEQKKKNHRVIGWYDSFDLPRIDGRRRSQESHEAHAVSLSHTYLMDVDPKNTRHFLHLLETLGFRVLGHLAAAFGCRCCWVTQTRALIAFEKNEAAVVVGREGTFAALYAGGDGPVGCALCCQ